ncbi:MAG: hypothetical protein WC780_03845 [Lentimicrobiaceae bacterium]|jgi:hypothetical protein
MKSSSLLFCIFLLFLGFSASAQDYNEERLNLPGDNLNLYAVMKLFQESKTLEDFERNLNAADSKINNLDLNGDDRIDYIRVIDYVNGNDHTIVLQDPINDKESQDVAVFTVQKDANNNVLIQLIGDEELYGKDYIIEPNYDDAVSANETPNPGYTGNTRVVNGVRVVETHTTYVEVARWPLISYLFLPSYIAWHSPWYWGYYPSYWSPWRPFYWDYYYGYHSHWNHYYYGHYRPWHTYRYTHWNDYYYKTHRTYSNTVHQRRQSGSYKSTYSRPDLRKQGSADYVKRYPANRDGSKSRNATNTGVNRQKSQPGVGRITGKRGENKPAVRQNTNKSTNRQGVSNQRTKSTERKSVVKSSKNKPSVRSGVNKSSDRPANTKRAVRYEKKRDAVKKEPAKRSSETKKSRSTQSEKPDRK